MVEKNQFQIPTLEGNIEQKTENNIPNAVRQITGGSGTLQVASERSNMGQCHILVRGNQ